MKPSSILSFGILCAAPALVSAQDVPFHANLRDNLDISGAVFSDIWGLENRAYMGRFGQGRFDLIDMANPDNLSLTSTAVIPSPNNLTSAQDIKVARSLVDPSRILAFVSLESGGPDGIQIWDVTNQNNPQPLTTIDVTPGSYGNTHNLSYRDDGWLVLCNSATSDAAIIDLRNYDPLSPPASITSWDYRIANLGSGFVHDVTISDQYLLLAQWNSLIVYDVSNLNSQGPQFVAEIQGVSCHAVWATEDSAFIVTTEERAGGAIRLFELVDSGGSFDLRQVDSFVNPANGTGSTFSAHNPLMLDDRLYVANYSAGVIVLEIDRSNKKLEVVASYDTSTRSPAGFDGSWGVYPLLGHDRVIASDFDNGVYTIDFSALRFLSQAARPTNLIPGAATTIAVDITELGTVALNPGTVELRVRFDGGSFSTIPMANIVGNSWEGNLPGSSCGTLVEYYFAASTMGGEEFTFPAKAPAVLHQAFSTVDLVEVFSDDFNTNKGWTVSNDGSLTTGAWERGAPVETGAQPGTDAQTDAGNSCYMTQNGSVGGSTSATDVDGGPTRLQSPNLDFSSGDGLISFQSWAFNTNADPADGLEVQIRESSGNAWVTVKSGTLKAGGWIPESFRVSDYVTPTATVQVRFLVADNPNNSLTEAGVDDFHADLFCDSVVAATATFFNGGGSNTSCLTTTSPKIGQLWSSVIDHSINPGAVATSLVVYSGSSTGMFLSGGEVLIDPASLVFMIHNLPVTGTSNTHIVMVPADLSLAGVVGTAQGVVLGGGFKLCNAYNLVVGF